jgi:hypothetical protein
VGAACTGERRQSGSNGCSWRVRAGGATATAAGLAAAAHGRCKQDATRTKERARLRRARMKLKCSSSEPTRTESNEAAHGNTLARTAAEEPMTRQGRGERESGSRKGCAGQRRARRQRLAHRGVSAGCAQAATELVYRKVARDAGSAAARRFEADPPRGQ